MDKDLINRANRDYNEDRLKLIMDKKMLIEAKIKKHDDLFRVYTKKLRALR
ncbi:MAG: hypothetical protein ACFFDF_17170 [Candidatus Odinarchaeota archaeon]